MTWRGKYIRITCQIYWLMQKFRSNEKIEDLPRRKRPQKLTHEMLQIINSELTENDEINSWQLQSSLKERYPSLHVLLQTIRCVHKKLDWVSTKPHYCQLIRDLNKRKRYLWCQYLQRSNEKFENVIFTDECTVQLDRHSRLCFRKKTPAKKVEANPMKLHIWGRISSRGATNIIMFSGIMNAPRYQQILEAGLLPFLHECFPDGHRLQQDNDPKHCSLLIGDFFSENGVFWWHTPPESPDLNPIENVWGSLKQFLRTTYKPKNLDKLKNGIRFWSSLTPEICNR